MAQETFVPGIARVILALENQAGVLAVLRETLEAEGHRVLGAATADAALAIFARERPALVIIGHGTLAAGGREFVVRARAIDTGIPIVVLSDGLSTVQRRALIQELGIVGVHDRARGGGSLLEVVDGALVSARAIERVHASQELRGLVLAKLCDDLRGALNTIRGYTDVLEGDPNAASVHEIPARLSAACDTAISLTQDYFTLARVEAPGVSVCRESVDVDALLLALRASGEQRIGSRPLHLRIETSFHGATVFTDGEKLRAILTQLLANAITFSAEGDIRLMVRSRPGRAEFVVADTGPGMGADELPAVIGPGAKLRHDAMASAPGQGVGLAIAVRLTALIGGSLGMRRGGNGGTVFSLSLPVTLGRPAEAAGVTVH